MNSTLSAVVAVVLSVLLACPAQGTQPAQSSKHAAKMKSRVAAIPVGSMVRVKSVDRRLDEGRLTSVGEETFELQATNIRTIAYRDVSSVERTDGPPAKSSRKWTIVALVIVGVVAVIVAVAAATYAHNE